MASRFAAMEEMRADIERREEQQHKEVAAVREDLEAQLKVVQVKVKANGRAIRTQAAAVEHGRGVSEEVRERKGEGGGGERERVRERERGRVADGLQAHCVNLM